MENGLLYYDVDARVIKEAEYIIKERATVRSTAKVFGVSKSTVHHDLTTRLEFLDEDLYEKVKKHLNVNLSERHIRGGNATRDKYREEARKRGGQLLRVHRARKTKPAAQKGSRFRRFEKGQLRAAK